MSIEQIVALLVEERDRLDRAIHALGGGATKRRGRPPKSDSQPASAPVESGASAATKKRGWTTAQKKAQRDRMKAYWQKERGS